MILGTNKKKKVYFINDRMDLNLRYRSALMTELELNGYEVISLSLLKIFILRFTKRNNDIVYSSNLRSNILTLLLFYRNVNIILNGLGRLKNKYLFRLFLGGLFSVGSRNIFFQNYRDYRYFRKYFKVKNTFWVPGSGASKKITALESGFYNINRNSKIPLCIDELQDFISKYDTYVKIVGVDKFDLLPTKAHPIGWVDNKLILTFGDKFVWFGGYGEGFPHSLADALFNRVETYISRREFINLGIYKMKKYYKKNENWYILAPQDFSNLSSKCINLKYFFQKDE